MLQLRNSWSESLQANTCSQWQLNLVQSRTTDQYLTLFRSSLNEAGIDSGCNYCSLFAFEESCRTDTDSLHMVARPLLNSFQAHQALAFSIQEDRIMMLLIGNGSHLHIDVKVVPAASPDGSVEVTKMDGGSPECGEVPMESRRLRSRSSTPSRRFYLNNSSRRRSELRY